MRTKNLILFVFHLFHGLMANQSQNRGRSCRNCHERVEGTVLTSGHRIITNTTPRILLQ